MARRVHASGPRLALVGRRQADFGARAGVDVEEEELVALCADDGVAAVEPGLLFLVLWGRRREVRKRKRERESGRVRES